METKVFALFAIVLVMGVVFSFPAILAQQDDSGLTNADNDRVNDVKEQDIINALVSPDNVTDKEDEEKESDDSKEDEERDSKDETEIEVEIETEEGKSKFKVKARGNVTVAQIRAALQEKNHLRLHANETVPEGCRRTGSSLKCDINGTRTMTVFAGQSGNIIIQSKGVNASTNVRLYHHNGEVYGLLDDNETRLIDLLPDQVRDRVKERIRAKISENETEIELDDEGNYEIRTRKESRFLGLFKVREKLRLKVDSQTGNVLSERAPWWGFLANDIEAEDEFDNISNSTDTNSSE